MKPTSMYIRLKFELFCIFRALGLKFKLSRLQYEVSPNKDSGLTYIFILDSVTGQYGDCVGKPSELENLMIRAEQNLIRRIKSAK